MKQDTMFKDGQDLPLFSGVAQQAQDERFDPQQAVVQSSLFGCPICHGTGYVNVDGKLRRCGCGAGDLPQL